MVKDSHLVLTWIVTREAADAAREVEALRARGLVARAVPCIATRWVPWPSWAPAEGESVTLFTSRRAVRAWVEAGSPAMGLLAALAPRTAQALHSLGVAPRVLAEGGALALARAVVAEWRRVGTPRWQVRYPTSDVGEVQDEQRQALAMLEQLGPVERRAVYLTRAPDGLALQVDEATRGPYVLTLASPSAAKHFIEAQASRAPEQVVCIGASTVRAWDSSRPSAWPMARLVKSLEP